MTIAEKYPPTFCEPYIEGYGTGLQGFAWTNYDVNENRKVNGKET